MFAHEFGIPEDPATGSANGCLAGYLVKHGYFGHGPVRASVEQGFEMGRKSILHLDAGREAGSPGMDAIAVNVGGKVIEVAEGRLL
jgi:trans-2,3-dihydro-3-hydroxyanthranilate isomerase